MRSMKLFFRIITFGFAFITLTISKVFADFGLGFDAVQDDVHVEFADGGNVVLFHAMWFYPAKMQKKSGIFHFVSIYRQKKYFVLFRIKKVLSLHQH